MHRNTIPALLLALLILFSCAGCASTQPIKEKNSVNIITSTPTSTPEPTPYIDPDGLTGELTINRFTNEGMGAQEMEFIIEDFTKLHPGVTINLQIYKDGFDVNSDNREELLREYRIQLEQDVRAGIAGDLLFDIPEGFSYAKLFREGALLDLLPYWEGDPDITPEDYFTEAVDVFRIDGGLPVMPIAFCFAGGYLNRDVLTDIHLDAESIGSVDLTKLTNWYEQALKKQPGLQFSFGGRVRETAFDVERTAYMGESTAEYQSQEFLDFLVWSGTLQETDYTDLPYDHRRLSFRTGAVNELIRYRREGDESKIKGHPDMESYMAEGAISMVCLSGIDIYTLAYVSQPLENLAGPYPWTDTKGQLSVLAEGDFAVPASCQDPDLAWEFISYYLKPRDKMRLKDSRPYTGGIPLNKENTASLIKAINGDVNCFSYEKQCGLAMNHYAPEVTIQRIEDYLQMPLLCAKACCFDAGEAVNSYYFEQVISAKECAAEIQKAAEEWLLE